MNSSPYPVQEVDIDTDHWEQLEQDGQYHAAAQQELQDLRQRFQELSRQMSQMGASSSGHAHTSSERTPTPPSLGSDNPAEDKHVRTMMYTIWKQKIAVWRRQVQGRVPTERQASMIAQELRGKCAETIWMGLSCDSDICHVDGLTRIQDLLDKFFMGDMAATVSHRIDEAMAYRRSKDQPLDDFIRNLRLKLQNLDEVGEVLPVRIRANLLLKNANITEMEKAVVLATTGRTMEFNAIADALLLIFGQPTKPERDHPESGMMGYTRPNSNRVPPPSNKGGKGGKGKGGRGFRSWNLSNTCLNCFQPGHVAAECKNETVCTRCKQTGHRWRECPTLSHQGNTCTEELVENQYICNTTFEESYYVIDDREAWLFGIIDSGCTRSVACDKWLKEFEKYTKSYHERLPPVKGRAFVFGGSSVRHHELFNVELKINVFGMETTIDVSIISGQATPLLVSKKQLSLWKTVIHVETGRVEMLLNGKRVTFISPETKAGLQLLPIDARQAGQVGVNVKPGGYEVNMLIDDMGQEHKFDDNGN